MTTQVLQTSQPSRAKGIHNVSCEQLEEIDSSLEDVSGLKLIDLGGTLEIMPIPRSVWCSDGVSRGDSPDVLEEARGKAIQNTRLAKEFLDKCGIFPDLRLDQTNSLQQRSLAIAKAAAESTSFPVWNPRRLDRDIENPLKSRNPHCCQQKGRKTFI